MSTAGFDELIHAPTRLEIVSLLAAAQWADFKYIRDEVGLSDSALTARLSPTRKARWAVSRRRCLVDHRRGAGRAGQAASAGPAARVTVPRNRP